MKRLPLKTRPLRFESLERRFLLSVNWVVNTTADYSAWVEDDSVLSLREAVSRAGDGDVITFNPALSPANISLRYGELKVNAAITIDASSLRTPGGTNNVVINAAQRGRAFNIAEGASLTLNAVNIQNGFSSGDGGAIYTMGDLILNNCNISLSRAEYGGGIYSNHGSVAISGGSVVSCTSSANGGGIYSYIGILNIENASISSNTASMSGGGIDANGSITTINRSVVSNNRSTDSAYFAGGIFAHGESIEINDSKITGNSSLNYGGGIYVHDADAFIVNSLIAGNSSMYTGGGIENFGRLTLRQCTIAGNRTTGSYSGGAGIYNYYGQGMYLDAFNCIIAENTSASGKDTCNYEGNGYGYGYNVLTNSTTDWLVQLNFVIDNFFEYDPSLPLFTDRGAGDYTLAADSQAIDLGDEAYLFYEDGSDILYDLAGHDRVSGITVDLGAYEYYPKSKLDAPTGVTLSSAGANRLRVSWDAVPDSLGYTVYWSTNQTSWSQAFSGTNTTRLTGLTYGETYYVRVRALGDNVNWTNSDFSATVSSLLCPVDIDGDGFIGPGDYSILSNRWFTSEGNADWDERCDIDGDGFVGPGDRSFISANWFKTTNSGTIVYPPALAVAVASDDIFDLLDAELEEILEEMI